MENSPPRPRILLIDDDGIAAAREALVQQLIARGYDAEALQRAADAPGFEIDRRRPDLVLLNLHTPGIDCAQLLREIRRMHYKHELPVILIADRPASPELLAAMEAGANDYVVAPINLAVLVARIEMGLDVRRACLERTASELALRESEQRFRLSFDHAPIGMALIRLDGGFVRVNAALCRMSGYSPQELLTSMTWESVSIRDDIDPTWERARKMMDGKVDQYEIEKRIRHKNGQILWTLVCTSLARDPAGKPLYFICQVQDFTERRRTAEELRHVRDELERRVRERTAELEQVNRRLLEHQRASRQLASQVSLAEEQERRRIAAGLHDDVGQMLALMKMKLGQIDPHGVSAVADELRAVRKLLDESIRRTRSLTFDLGARVLYEFGLSTAIENLVDQFREQHRGITATFADDELPKPLDEGIEVALFRATRELLHNVAKHSRANQLDVRLSCDTVDCRCVRIEVSDDGIGFDPVRQAAQPPKDGGFGLFNIRERLQYVGGKMTIDSSPKQGTQVTRAPMKQEAAVSAEPMWQI